MGKIRLLIVDDHHTFRHGLKELLETKPLFEVVGEARDGLEAIKLTENLRPDVVLMDVSMPNMNGIDATQQILSAFPNTKVVVLSVFKNEQLTKHMLEVGASECLSKDTDEETLFQTIESAYKQRERGVRKASSISIPKNLKSRLKQ